MNPVATWAAACMKADAERTVQKETKQVCWADLSDDSDDDQDQQMSRFVSD